MAASMVPLLSGDNWGTNVSVEGFPRRARYGHALEPQHGGSGLLQDASACRYRSAATSRDPTPLGAPKVAIVNEAFAQKFNLGANPVGKRMAQGRSSKLDMEIIGLAKDAKYSEVKEPVPPVFFTPYRQSERVDGLVFYVATAGSMDTVMAAIPPTDRAHRSHAARWPT